MPKRKWFVKEGQQFERLTVIKEIDRYRKGIKQRYVLCRCVCGKEVSVNIVLLYRDKNNTVSCGCAKRDRAKKMGENNIGKNITHYHSKTKLYKVWIDIKSRTTNPNKWEYKNYGGRGIVMCDEWSDFLNFYNWAMDNNYSPSLQIERINNSESYSPSNCKWATRREQNSNKRTNRIIIYDSKRFSAIQFARTFNLRYYALLYYLRKYMKKPEELLILCKAK
jgi:hypothetical protein